MRIAVFGGTGFVGKKLQVALKEKGYAFVLLDLRRDSTWETQLKECDAVVNLAGHPLFGERWSERVKAKIFDSRVDGTQKIVAALKNSKVKCLVNASAVGIYGAGERDCDEESSLADDFLARVCKAWEEAATAAQRLYKIRTVCLRLGIILGQDGGALKTMLTPFKLGIGGDVGSGHQSMSWVHVDDVVGIILSALENDKIQGPLNVTSPNIVSNHCFSKQLGKTLHRPAFLPLPKAALYVMVGEAAGVIASGQRAHPKKILQYGYSFKYPKLEEALRNLLQK